MPYPPSPPTEHIWRDVSSKWHKNKDREAQYTHSLKLVTLSMEYRSAVLHRPMADRICARPAGKVRCAISIKAKSVPDIIEHATALRKAATGKADACHFMTERPYVLVKREVQDRPLLLK